MACAAFTACKRTTKVKNMSSVESNLFSEKVTDVHPVIPILTLQFVEELCGLIVESFISVILRDGSTNTMTVNILFVVFSWTGHLSHLDPFSCPLVPCLWKPTRPDRDRTILSLLLESGLSIPPWYISQNPLSSQHQSTVYSCWHHMCRYDAFYSRQCIKKFRWISISCFL